MILNLSSLSQFFRCVNVIIWFCVGRNDFVFRCCMFCCMFYRLSGLKLVMIRCFLGISMCVILCSILCGLFVNFSMWGRVMRLMFCDVKGSLLQWQMMCGVVWCWGVVVFGFLLVVLVDLVGLLFIGLSVLVGVVGLMLFIICVISGMWFLCSVLKLGWLSCSV